jgi:hypothetical protein
LAHLHRDLLFSAGPLTLERFRVCKHPRAPARRYRLALCSRHGPVAAHRPWSPLNGGDPRRKDRLELNLGLNVFLELASATWPKSHLKTAFAVLSASASSI